METTMVTHLNYCRQSRPQQHIKKGTRNNSPRPQTGFRQIANQSDRQKFVSNLARSHSRIDQHSHEGKQRPETARVTRSKSSGNGQDFETQMGQIMKLKNSSTVLNSSIIETWINETLKDAEHLEIPGIIVKPGHKQPLSRYKIDKLYLHSQGVSMQDVERIYRSLFVYSVGFYEMITKCVQHATNKFSILSGLWKVFQILLEYCCKSNYQMMVAKISIEHKEQMDQMEEGFNHEIAILRASEKQMREEFESFTVDYNDLKKNLQLQRFETQKLEEDIRRQRQTHEEEVSLRLQFESKLNSLHSLHRDLQSKYDRSVSDIFSLETLKKMQREKIEKQNDELLVLRQKQIESEATIVFQSERIKAQTIENTQRKTQVQSLEEKLLQTHQLLEQQSVDLREIQSQANNAIQSKQNESSILANLQTEKKHLEAQLKENQSLKDKYKTKNAELTQEMQDLFKECENNKRQLIGVDELKKDRDARISALRDEIELLSRKYDQQTKDLASTVVQVQSLESQLKRANEQFEQASEHLTVSNTVRQQMQDKQQDVARQLATLQVAFAEKDRLMILFKTKYEQESKRYIESERYLHQTELQKKAIEKQAEIQRRQMHDKLTQFQQQINSEKDTREIWITRYEQAQKAHVNTHTEYIQLRGELQELQLKFDNQLSQLQSLEDQKVNLNKHITQLQENYNQMVINCERVQREVSSKDDLIKQIGEQNQQQVLRLKKEVIDAQMQGRRGLEVLLMGAEDLRTFTVGLFQREQQLQKEVVQVGIQLKREISLKEKNILGLQKMTKRFEVELKLTDQLKEELEQLNGLLNNKGNLISQMQETHDDQCSRILSLEGQVNAITIANGELSQFLQQLRQKNDELDQKCTVLETRLLQEHNDNKVSKKTQTKYKTKQKEAQTDLMADVRTDNDQTTEDVQSINYQQVKFEQPRPFRVMSAVQPNIKGLRQYNQDQSYPNLQQTIQNHSLGNVQTIQNQSFPQIDINPDQGRQVVSQATKYRQKIQSIEEEIYPIQQQQQKHVRLKDNQMVQKTLLKTGVLVANYSQEFDTKQRVQLKSAQSRQTETARLEGYIDMYADQNLNLINQSRLQSAKQRSGSGLSVKGNGSIRTLIRIANSRVDE